MKLNAHIILPFVIVYIHFAHLSPNYSTSPILKISLLQNNIFHFFFHSFLSRIHLCVRELYMQFQLLGIKIKNKTCYELQSHHVLTLTVQSPHAGSIPRLYVGWGCI